MAAAAETEASAGAVAAEAVPAAGAEAVHAGAGHAASAEVEAPAPVTTVGAGAAPEAEAGADVDAATGDVPDVEVGVAATEARVWAEVETKAGLGSVPVDTRAGRMAGAELEPAAAVAVEGAEAEADTEAVDATAGAVAGAEMEAAAAAEAVLYVEVSAETGYWGREREAVSAAEAKRRSGGAGRTATEAEAAKTVAAAMGGDKAGDVVGAWRLGVEVNPGEECWWVVLGSSTEEAVDGPVRLEEALKAFAMSVEVAGLSGDGQLLTELEGRAGG